MGLGRLMRSAMRSTEYTARDTITGATAVYTVVDNLAPDWPSSSYRGGMSIPGAWRAANMLADLLGSIPWDAYRTFGGRPVEVLNPAPPLLEQPSPPDTRMTTFSSWGLDYLWEGNAIGVVADRNAFGWPTAAIPVPARHVAVRRITKFVDSPLPVGAVEYSIGSLRLGSRDVVHIKGPCEPGALRGMGVLEAHLNTLDLAAEQGRQARSISRAGVPTGILKSTNPDASTEDLKAAKEQWLVNQRDRTVAALNATTEFIPLSWNPEEMQLVEARKFTLTEFELIFGLPPGWLGGQQSTRSYSNLEMDSAHLLKYGSPEGIIARFEQSLSLMFPRGTRVKANLDALLRASTKDRYEAHKIGIDAGFLMPSEARELEDRPPIPGLDEAWMARLSSTPARQPIQATANAGRPGNQLQIEGSVADGNA